MPASASKEKDPGFVLVEKGEDFAQIAARMKKEGALGVDLEADSLYHYKEKVCLLQVSTETESFILDPLALRDLSPLIPVFSDSNIQKVFHGADFDLRSLRRDFSIQVNSLFDTQIAARFLGINEIGLASILKTQLGITIGKKYQKKDWSKRPLPEAMLSYAVKDSCHLIPLARILRKELRALGRLAWVEEESAVLSKVTPAAPNEGPLFLSFKGARKLDRRGLAVLETVLRFRDEVARRRDLPVFKVLRSGPVMEIAERRPVTERELKRVKGLSQKQISAMGPSLLKGIHRALSLPEDSLPHYPRKSPRPVAHFVRKRAKVLKAWREERAKGLGLDGALVCTNSQIRAIAREHPREMKDLEHVQGVRNWQKQVFGEEICGLMKKLR